MQPVYVKGMHGLGDNLHQRAIMRELSKQYVVYLETSWPQVYFDMPNVRCVRRLTTLRTQTKNAEVAAFYEGPRPLNYAHYYTIRYSLGGSVLESMNQSVGTHGTDFSFNPPWQCPIAVEKPILIYRPLTQRREFESGAIRNPERDLYFDMFHSIPRERFFVVSVADLEPKHEWMVSHPVDVDLELHRGELSFEQLAALFFKAKLVYTAPGFGIIMAKAVGTPVISVFGGYEGPESFSHGGPMLAITDGIDYQKNHDRIWEFVNASCC